MDCQSSENHEARKKKNAILKDKIEILKEKINLREFLVDWKIVWLSLCSYTFNGSFTSTTDLVLKKACMPKFYFSVVGWEGHF